VYVLAPTKLVVGGIGESCVLLTPTFARFAKSIGGIVKVGAVDLTAEPTLLARLGIRDPNPAGVWLIRPTSLVERNRLSSAVRLPPRDRPTTEQDILDFLEKEIPYAGSAVRSEEAFRAWSQEHQSHPRLLLVTNKPRVPLLYKALSVAFDQVRFGAARHTRETDPIYRKFRLQGVPGLLWFPPGPLTRAPELYDGEFTRKGIADFLTNAVPFHGRFVQDRASLDRFLIRNAERPKVLLVTPIRATPLTP